MRSRILFFCLLFMYTDFCYSEQRNATSSETSAFDTLIEKTAQDTSMEIIDTLQPKPHELHTFVKREKSDSCQSKKKKKEPFYANEAFLNSYSPNYGKVNNFAQYVEAGYKYKYKILPYVNVQAGLASKYLSLISTLDASLEFDYFQIGVTGLGGYLLFLKENQIHYYYYTLTYGNETYSTDTTIESIKSKWLFEYLTHIRLGTKKWNMSISAMPALYDVSYRNRLNFYELSLTLNVVTFGAFVEQLRIYSEERLKNRLNERFKKNFDYGGYNGAYLGLNNLIYIRNVKVTPIIYCSFYSPIEDMVIRFTALFEW